MDEISPSGCTYVWEVADGRTRSWELNPDRLGLGCSSLEDLAGGAPDDNAAAIEGLLAGQGAETLKCAALLNAAAALYVSGNNWSFEESVARSREALDSGAAALTLTRLRAAAPRAQVRA
jgi:anthranilate phosphoribosyltransferase